MIIAKICFHAIVYPFHLPKSRTLSSAPNWLLNIAAMFFQILI